MHTRSLRAVYALVCLMIASTGATRLPAQEVTATILGTVTDAAGAALTGADVTVTDLDTKQAHHETTSGSGAYRFDGLAVGTYRVDISSSGFRTFSENNIELLVNQERRVDGHMEIGNVEQKVLVNATAVQVETTNTQLGQV